MKNLILLMFAFGAATLSHSTITHASGGDDYSNEEDSTLETLESFREQQVVVDPTYESGKAVYTGRSKNAPKLQYCLRVGEETVKLKRKSIKQFKQSSYSDLAKNLYRCDVPAQAIKTELEKQQFLHVLYYLNKRYKLNLARA